MYFTKNTFLAIGVLSAGLLAGTPHVYASNLPNAISVEQASRKVVGTVVDSKGESIIGANVIVKGTSNGIITDIDGKFSLDVPEGAILEVSYIGYKTEHIKIGNKYSLKIVLKEDTETLDEVVVVGYGTMKKSDLSGSSATVSEDAIKGSIVTNIDQSLQGRVTGVNTVSTSGAPGTSSAVRVRGIATLNANAEPLYVVDGVILQNSGSNGQSYGLGGKLGSNSNVSTVSPIASIDPSDIVSMEVLKDASATAIYGAQGANGVILITTKRGKAGQAKVSYSGMVAAQHQNKRLDMMNLREFADYTNGFCQMYNQTPDPFFTDPSLLGEGTNWTDAIYRTALQHQHQVSIRGGSEKVKYYVSGAYMNQDGTIIGSNFNRYNFRVNLDTQITSWLKFGINASFSSTNDDLKKADGTHGLIVEAAVRPPSYPIYDLDGNYSAILNDNIVNPNPIALSQADQILVKRQKLFGSMFADVNIVKGLTFHTEIGFDYSYNKGETYDPTMRIGNWTRDVNTSAIQKRNSNYWQVKNYLTYNGTFGKHSFSAMVGQEAWKSSYDLLRVENTGLPSDAVHNPSLGTGTPSTNCAFGSESMASFFTRETYNYDNRYLATYTYRLDGSSNFGPNNRWAGFHSVAASWRFSNEKFFEPIKNVISNGKLRLGWGQTGNSAIGGFLWGTKMMRLPTGLGLGFRPFNLANPNVSWETQQQFNIGLDLGFFNGRMNLVVDIYKKISKDMLMGLQLPSYMGTEGNSSSCIKSPMGNFGEIENKGIEISLDTHPIVGKFEWDSSIQFSVNRNRLNALTGTENAQIVGRGRNQEIVSVSQVGSSLYDFYGYVTDGVYQNLEDLKNSPKTEAYPSDGQSFDRTTTVWVGDLKFKDLNKDGKIDENDRTSIGSPLPKFTFGWTNTFRYHNFDLSLFINGSVGNKILNYLNKELTTMRNKDQNQLNVVNDRTRLEPIDPNKVYPEGQSWVNDITNIRVANPGAVLPRIAQNDPNGNIRVSDRYIEDGSYVRLKNITLGYTFPKQMLRKISVETLRLYVNIQNLVTITGYDGFDPEIGSSTAEPYVFGMDYGRYPSPTVYSFGMNLTF